MGIAENKRPYPVLASFAAFFSWLNIFRFAHLDMPHSLPVP
jgi:hypothetical protein